MGLDCQVLRKLNFGFNFLSKKFTLTYFRLHFVNSLFCYIFMRDYKPKWMGHINLKSGKESGDIRVNSRFDDERSPEYSLFVFIFVWCLEAFKRKKSKKNHKGNKEQSLQRL